MKNKKWELFSHEADMGIRGIGPTLVDAFEMAAIALTAVVTDPQLVKSQTEININCTAPDREILFLDWINAIIYQMDTRQMLFSQFQIDIKDNTLAAIIKGEPVDRVKHQPAVDVKGATFTALRVIQENNIWIAQCVVDV